ncbi:MAG: hypothetical protein ACSHWY_00215 [Octadecabacter sp.]
MVLGIKHKGEREKSIVVLDPDDPFVDDGGTRIIEGIPNLLESLEPKTRLVPAASAGVEARRGNKFLQTRVNQNPAKFELSWDPEKEKALIKSEHASQVGHLWFDANRLRRREEASLNPYDEPVPSGALAVDAAEDIIFDIGMSKIVAVTAERGWISAEELERIVRDGYPSYSELQTVKVGNPVSNVIPMTSGDSETDLIRENGDSPSQEDVSDPRRERSKKDRSDTAKDLGSGGANSKDGIEGKIPGKEHFRAIRSSSPSKPGPVVPDAWISRVSDTEFSQALTSLHDVFQAESPALSFDDVVVAILALSVTLACLQRSILRRSVILICV